MLQENNKKIMSKNLFLLVAALLSTGYAIYWKNLTSAPIEFREPNLILVLFYIIIVPCYFGPYIVLVSSWLMYLTKNNMFWVLLNMLMILLTWVAMYISNSMLTWSINIVLNLLFLVIIVILQIIGYKQESKKMKIFEEKIAKGEIKDPKIVSLFELKEKNLFLQILLSIGTFGFYNLCWISYITEDVNMKSDGRKIPPIISGILFVLTFGLYLFYWIYNVEKKIQNIKLKYKLPITNNIYLYFILLAFGILVTVFFHKVILLLSITGLLYFIQKDLNNIARNINDNNDKKVKI